METILNLTQHNATEEQKAVGVVGIIDDYEKKMLVEMLTFDEIPTKDEMKIRAKFISFLAWKNGFEGKCVMIGGAPFFMPYLEKALKDYGMKPVYAFSKRESVEEMQPDGTVKKTNVFKHIGFIEA